MVGGDYVRCPVALAGVATRGLALVAVGTLAGMAMGSLADGVMGRFDTASMSAMPETTEMQFSKLPSRTKIHTKTPLIRIKGRV